MPEFSPEVPRSTDPDITDLVGESCVHLEAQNDDTAIAPRLPLGNSRSFRRGEWSITIIGGDVSTIPAHTDVQYDDVEYERGKIAPD